MSPPRRSLEEDYYHLRTEWLRFKNHVYDTNTDLPTLPAVLDDVRRLMEERGTLGLLYLDLGGEGETEALHGWQAWDDVLRAFAATLADLRREGLLGARDIVAVLSVRSDKFLLFLGGNGSLPLDRGSFESLSARVRQGIDARLPPRLPSFLRPPLTFDHGHALMYRDPMLRPERCVHRALDAAMFMSIGNRTRDEDRRAQGLDAILNEKRLVVLYQPIFDLADLRVLGHEVFTRGPAGDLEDPEHLFTLAGRTGRLVDLERLCRARALGSARGHVKPGEKLFLKTSAGALRDSDVAGAGFIRQVDREGLPHSDIVLEITERVASQERQGYRGALEWLKGAGFGIAIDDMGAGYSSLQAIVELEPAYLKFDIALVRNIDRSLIKRSLLETLVELSAKIGAQVIAEGIEAASELTTLRDMGVRLGQGRFLAAPVPVPADVPAS